MLVGVARGAQLVGNDVYNATLAASVITIVLNRLLMNISARDKTVPVAAEMT